MKCLFIVLTSLFAISVHGQSALEIVQKADEKMRGSTSQGELIIRTVRPGWTRETTVRTWIKGTDMALILVLAPAKDKGIVFLKRKKEVWNWMPSLERTIKLPPSMMSQSWMGTDFTNDDLVKESSIVHDYTHSIIGDTVVSGRSSYIVQMIPKPEAAVVWGKLIVTIDKKDLLELHTRFYDEDGTLVNTMNGYDVKLMDGRLIPTRFEMIPADKPNQKTIMIYKNIRYNQPIDNALFTTQRMQTIGN